MIDLLKKELVKQGALTNNYHPLITKLAKVLPEETIPYKMKLTLAVNEIILFASQFRKNILHWNGSKIPINSISFVLNKSGSNKDKSINLLRNTFSKGYHLLHELRIERAIQKAKNKAEEEGDDPKDETAYAKYYKVPSPLFVAPSTNEGFIQYLNELDEEGIGAGFIYSGEFSSELNSSSVIIQNLQLISELYDEGKKEVKIIKDKEKQSKEIRNLPVSALFISSPDQLIYEESIKKKFKLEFASKLARRSFFNYNKEEVAQQNYTSIEEMLQAELAREDKAIEISQTLRDEIYTIASDTVSILGEDIQVENSVRELFILYQRYNKEVADLFDTHYPLAKLVRQHLQWKVLKLSGAIAFFNGHYKITAQDYILAINFTELLDEDMKEFEDELNKELYELFVDLAHKQIDDEGKCTITLHTLKKLGYLTGNSNLTNKLIDLAQLSSSYDTSGVYKALDNGIEFTQLTPTETIGVSYILCEGTKEDRAKKASQELVYIETTFDSLKLMLSKSLAYSPFEFKSGIRNNKNIISTCKWLALDIDKSIFTDKETHELLTNVNHHIARTSDKDNPYKFRILLELDSEVNVEDKYWKKFIQSITQYYSLDADILPKSQIFFSYPNREILSVIDKQPVEVREHLLFAIGTTPMVSPRELSKPQKKALLQAPLDTFHYAYYAEQGEGSFSLIRAAKHARDLGATREEVISLIEDINSYWVYPMEQLRFQNTIINQIERWEF